MQLNQFNIKSNQIEILRVIRMKNKSQILNNNSHLNKEVKVINQSQKKVKCKANYLNYLILKKNT